MLLKYQQLLMMAMTHDHDHEGICILRSDRLLPTTEGPVAIFEIVHLVPVLPVHVVSMCCIQSQVLTQ